MVIAAGAGAQRSEHAPLGVGLALRLELGAHVAGHTDQVGHDGFWIVEDRRVEALEQAARSPVMPHRPRLVDVTTPVRRRLHGRARRFEQCGNGDRIAHRPPG
jgi:hypothetical protein